MVFAGQIAALAASFLWASASLVYTRLGQTLPPILLNTLKGLVAIALLLLTISVLQPPWGNFSSEMVWILGISGLVGIGIGDTAYFSALGCLGARQTLLLETLAPLMGTILARIFLGEALSRQAWLGMLLTLVGVAWVITERTSRNFIGLATWRKGICWGILAAFAQAVGGVLSRSVLVVADVSPLVSSLIRLLAGTVSTGLIWQIQAPWRVKPPINWSFRLLAVLSLTAFGSTYLGIWLQQIALKYAPVGIAQTLTSTSPLFVLPLAFALGEKISLRAIFGAVIAILGIGCLFFS